MLRTALISTRVQAFSSQILGRERNLRLIVLPQCQCRWVVFDLYCNAIRLFILIPLLSLFSVSRKSFVAPTPYNLVKPGSGKYGSMFQLCPFAGFSQFLSIDITERTRSFRPCLQCPWKFLRIRLSLLVRSSSIARDRRLQG